MKLTTQHIGSKFEHQSKDEAFEIKGFSAKGGLVKISQDRGGFALISYKQKKALEEGIANGTYKLVNS